MVLRSRAMRIDLWLSNKVDITLRLSGGFPKYNGFSHLKQLAGRHDLTFMQAHLAALPICQAGELHEPLI